MREELTWLGGRKAGAARQREGEVQAFYGHFDAARRLLRHQFEDSAENAASPFLLPAFVLDLGLQEAEVGNTTAAQRLGKDSTQLRKNRGAEVDLALLLARSGQIEQAEKLAEKINRESPQDTLVQYYQLRTIRAAIKLHQKDPTTAIKILRPAEKYDLAYPDSFNSVYPAYIRGLAYLRLNQGRQAAVEFQKLLDHPAIVGRDVTGALAHLQIGRAQAMMGDNAAARKSYQDFLTLWKDADPDIPIFKEAKAEYAKLE
jgi:tetratricopeptide (TPR) repeat protein